MKLNWVKKANGELEAFAPEKLSTSLFKAGANESLINSIIERTQSSFDDSTTTKAIYKLAYKLLGQESYQLAGKYKLKNAILELGPTGYPFEKFVARLFNYQGYETEVGRTLNGKCITHEVDVFGQYNGNKILVECKHHSNAGYKSDVKVPLYVHSRFRDIENTLRSNGDNSKVQYWIATNTRFTLDAEQYASCAGLQLMAWDYPKKGNLKERISLSGAYPITCLKTLTKREKGSLLERDIMLCSELLQMNENAKRIVQSKKHERVMHECKSILNML